MHFFFFFTNINTKINCKDVSFYVSSKFSISQFIVVRSITTNIFSKLYIFITSLYKRKVYKQNIYKNNVIN